MQINTPDVNPYRGLAALPINLIDPSQLIANSCIGRSNKREGQFIITRNGGLPVTPDDPLVAPYQTYQIPTVESAGVSKSREQGGDSKASQERLRSMVHKQQSADRSFSTNSSKSTSPTASPIHPFTLQQIRVTDVAGKHLWKPMWFLVLGQRRTAFGRVQEWFPLFLLISQLLHAFFSHQLVPNTTRAFLLVQDLSLPIL
ncbi:MAG TPA: hypothetical protein V6C91_14775 [Coleofasciculaceae cyanobacterium]